MGTVKLNATQLKGRRSWWLTDYCAAVLFNSRLREEKMESSRKLDGGGGGRNASDFGSSTVIMMKRLAVFVMVVIMALVASTAEATPAEDRPLYEGMWFGSYPTSKHRFEFACAPNFMFGSSLFSCITVTCSFSSFSEIDSLC